jgi:hypothetical protein
MRAPFVSRPVAVPPARIPRNVRELAVRRMLGLVMTLTLGLPSAPAAAGFRSPDSLVRNVYAYYGAGTPELSGGLPHDDATARQFFDPSLRQAWASVTAPPYDFFVQSPRWKLGAVGIAITRRQYDRLYVAVNFTNTDKPVALNFIVVQGPDGWVIDDVETPHDSLRMFLVQFRK